MSTEEKQISPPAHQVGDELAFRAHARDWRIYKIERITKTGRLVCGPYTLNPDLSVRTGRECPYGAPYRGERVTDKIRREVRRIENLRFIGATNFNSMTDDQLDRIAEIIRSDGEVL